MTTKILEENKKLIRELWEENKSPETNYNLHIGNTVKILRVISLNLEYVYLNPRNHRLKAQLTDRNVNPDSLDPFSQNTQELLVRLLSETEEYPKLLAELKSQGQREPGLITEDGMLINGNTRYAALKEIEQGGKPTEIKVAVAVNINEADIVDIEMDSNDATDASRLYIYK